MILDSELEFYQTHLIDLLGPEDANEGKYVAIKGDQAYGPFDNYETALEQAYLNFGTGGFLVKKIERVETVLEFSRDLR